MALRVLLADDHHVVRQGLKALLEQHGFAVVAEVADGRAAVTLTAQLHPDVAVLDVAMPVLNGVDAAHEIAELVPPTRVVLLSALPDAQFASAALRAGVRGFVAKTQNIEDLAQAIHEVSEGRLYVSPQVSQTILNAVRAGEAGVATQLSQRERGVVRLVAEGKSTKEIAELLDISVKTAEFHRGRAMAKLGIHDVAGLVRYAIREGLIVP